MPRKPNPNRKQYRPRARYSVALVDLICERLAQGESLNKICKSDGMPEMGTFIGWAVDNRDGLSQKYARAREIQAELFAQKIEAVAQTLPEFATSTKADGTVEKRRDPAHVAWQKNQIDALKWIACKLRPKVYGDKLAVEGELTLNVADRLEAARKRINGG